MSFTAYKAGDAGRRELVSVINYDVRDGVLSGQRFICPECGQPMAFRFPWVRRPHFYHLRRDDIEHPCSLSASESPEHEAGKYYIATTIAGGHRYRGRVKNILIEHPMGARRADVAFEMQDGAFEVFEVQLAPINQVELKQRTEDYHAAGASIVNWFIGRGTNADTESNRAWIEEYAGECVVIDFRRESVNLTVG